MVYVSASPRKNSDSKHDATTSGGDGGRHSAESSSKGGAHSLASSPYSTASSSTSTIVTMGDESESLSLSFLRKKKRVGSIHEKEETPAGPAEPPSPPRLVRKKSGELVKSSLRLNSLGGVNSKSMPTTPTYNKSVHFGSDVDVRYFDEREKPTAVSAGGSPVLRGRRKIIGSASFEGLSNNSDTEDDSDIFDDEEKVHISWDLFNVNFNKIKYNEKFREGSQLFLEKFVLDDDDKCIIGTIAVKNLSFQKDVHVRYSYDQWRTVIEIEATYVPEVTKILKRANFDRFRFTIPLTKFAFLPNDKTEVSFCIRYRYDNKDLWDNNYFKNYKVILTRSRRLRGSRSAKFSLNDYFNYEHDYSLQSQSHSLSVDDYFGNYNSYNYHLKSPETPKALKTEEGTFLDSTPDFKSLDNISHSVAQMSLLSNDSKTSLLDFDKENLGDDALGPNDVGLGPTDVERTSNDVAVVNNGVRSNTSSKPNRKNKPPMNSKSYQELLDSYCFFTGEKGASIPRL